MPPGSRNAFSPNPVNAMGVPAGFGVEGTGTPSTMDFEVLRGMLGGAWQNLVSPLYLARDTAQSVRDMAPRGFYADLYEAGKRVAANPRAVPGMVQNALKQSAEYARSSPYAMGETMGGMLDVRNMLKRPPVANIVVHHGTTAEAAKKIAEEGFNPALSGSGQQFSAQVPGVWFTREPSITNRFGPVQLSEDVVLKKPYRMAASTYLQKFLYNNEDPVAFRNELEKKGYDGIRIAPHPEYAGGIGPAGTEEWGYENFVVFDPAKSIRKKKD